MGSVTQLSRPSAEASLDRSLAQKLPYAFAKRHGVVAARLKDNTVELWTAESCQPEILAEVSRFLGRPYSIQVINQVDFGNILNIAYERDLNQAMDLSAELGDDADLQELAAHLPQTEDLLESEDDAPIIRLINTLLSQAVREGASDIHIEPFETRSVVRFRTDGVLRDVMEPQRVLHNILVSRVKIMARLDIAEKRLPQDGRISLKLAGRPVDVRVSTLPTEHGERVVLRLLDKQVGRLDLAHLGMSDQVLALLRKIISQPHGIILVTGPTGSGKTTTLYAMLSQLNTLQHNIMTVEDPVEYDIDGIGQTQVNSKIELSFARALRAILRQDPDIIMIGEIRDLETAQIAVQASLTGHLVLATLHTNDAAGAVTRLVDMGVEPFLVASSLSAVLAQRLVRKLCPECKEGRETTPAELSMLNMKAGESFTAWSADGCPACSQTGYHSRTGVYELLAVDETVRSMIHDGTSEGKLRQYAREHGMIPLREDGVRWLRDGTTSLEELIRVTRD
ncbi:MAG: type II secretion system ATPase GspE [Acidiferrobacterales bacterium]